MRHPIIDENVEKSRINPSGTRQTNTEIDDRSQDGGDNNNGIRS